MSLTESTEPTEDLGRGYTRRLAQVLSTPDGTLALALLQKMAALQQPAPAPAPTAAEGDTVGIWRRTRNGAYERRPELKDEWHLWADTERLPLTAGRRRVAVLGESAARGYFFDPGTTYTGLFADCLRAVPGLDDVDVLDLARTSATMDDVRRTLYEAAALRPDGLVVFAGNNWYYPELGAHDRQRLAEAVRRGGFAESRHTFHAVMVERARAFLADVAETARTYDIRVTLVVPEFNLADWHTEPCLGAPVLPGSGNLAWQRLREDAEAALAAGQAKEAARLAGEMAELDGGTSVTAQRLLAAALRDEDPEAAERALVAAKDAAVGRFLPHAPRTLTAVQDELRAGAAAHGFALVDLPALLREAAGGRAPGREFFLDYCHFTYEGLALVAAGTAAALSPLLTGTAHSVDAAALRATLVAPSTERQAAAHFLAAIHNAHIGQPTELVDSLLERALTLDEGTAHHLVDYLDYQSRVAPNWVCEAFARSARVPELARYLEVGDPGSSVKLADHALRQSMLDLLATRGLADPAVYRERLITEHAGPETDLLSDANRAPTWRESADSPVQRHSYVTAPDPGSDSWLVLARPTEVELALTARLPEGEPAQAEASVRINGAEAGSVPLGAGWRTVRLTVPAGLWQAGLNHVEIRWPLRALPGDRLLSAAAEALERGETPCSLPEYAHLYAFTARPRTD